VDFEYTPEQIQLRKAVREFAEAEIAPHVMEWDEAQIFPLDVVRKLGGLGYMGSIFPEDLGGAGLGYIDYSIIIEELSRVDGSVGIILAAHTSLCSNHIYKMGSDEQRRRYLPKLALQRSRHRADHHLRARTRIECLHLDDRVIHLRQGRHGQTAERHDAGDQDANDQ